MKEKSIQIVVPAERLAAAVNKWLIPGLLRHAAQQQKDKKESTILINQQP